MYRGARPPRTTFGTSCKYSPSLSADREPTPSFFAACTQTSASERPAGRSRQIYPDDYAPRVSSRRRKLGKRTFEERTVPVESVKEYFLHFDVLEIDFTFYRSLLDADGTPTTNYGALQRCADFAPDNAAFLLKARPGHSHAVGACGDGRCHSQCRHCEPGGGSGRPCFVPAARGSETRVG